MPDNPQSLQDAWFSLSDHRLLTLSGRDAVAFAQAQTMNDVAALGEGGWQWSGWLTAKGRISALFALLRPHPDTVWLLLPDAGSGDPGIPADSATGSHADPAALAAALRRFVFRSKLSIEVREDLHISGRFAVPAQARAAQAAVDGDGSVEMDWSGDAAARTLRIGAIAAPDNPDALRRWRAADLRHGLPRLDASQREQWTPQQLSLERLGAFSVKKGCYPGQEIVARTHFLGQAKRGLALIDTGAMRSAPAVGDSLPDAAGQPLGSVISTAGDVALAVLPLDAAVDPSQVSVPANAEHPAYGEVLWKRLGLLGGMAR